MNNPERHHRRSIRLSGYDYTRAGAYFVTICTWGRACLFGNVIDETMQLNDVGRAVLMCWEQIPRHFPRVELDEFVVMPNHVHGILVLAVDTDRGTACRAPTMERFGKPVARSLPTIVRSFKSAASKRVNELVGVSGAPIWQRNYHEHIIRNEQALNAIRQYIQDNPSQWALDGENPANLLPR